MQHRLTGETREIEDSTSARDAFFSDRDPRMWRELRGGQPAARPGTIMER